MYELSHCGVDYSGKGRHTVHWIGSMAYRALHVPKMPKDVRVCPICGSDLVPYEYGGVDLDLEHEPLPKGHNYLSPEGWRPKRLVMFSTNKYGSYLPRFQSGVDY
jgi:hypothetical protein